MPSRAANQPSANSAEPQNVEDILTPFFSALEDSKLEYCVLHSYEALPRYVGSDLDIAIKLESCAQFESLLSKVAKTNHWEILQRLWYDIPRCYYYVLSSTEQPYRSVAIDILVDAHAIGRYGFDTDTLIQERVKDQGFYHADPSVEFCYKLVKRIRKGVFKAEDIDILNALFGQGDHSRINGLLSEHYGPANAVSLMEIFRNAQGFQGHLPEMRILSITQLIRKRYRTPGIVIRRMAWQIRRILNRIFQPSGVVIKLSSAHFQTLNRHGPAILDAVRPAFRHTIFKARWNMLDVARALSTSTLLIVSDSNKTESARISDDYFTVRNIPTSGVQDASDVDVPEIFQPLICSIRDLLRDRMAVRLDIS